MDCASFTYIFPSSKYKLYHLKQYRVEEEIPGLRSAGRIGDEALSDEILLLLVLQGVDALLYSFSCHLIGLEEMFIVQIMLHMYEIVYLKKAE